MKLFYFSSFIATLAVVVSGVLVKRDGDYDFAVKENIKYGEKDANVLDVYYDKKHLTDLKPVIIYLHGGFWYGGDKNDDRVIGTTIQNQNYIAVLPNYRLFPEVKNIDDMITDVFNALIWTKSNIMNYGGDVEQVTLAGYDAGAHLAALTVLKSAFNDDINNKTLHKTILFKHLLLFNGQYSFDDFEKLAYEINMMRENAKLAPALAYLDEYANTMEGLFLGKSGYDAVKILEKKNDQSIYSIGADKISFIECDKDANIPLGASDKLIGELKRVVSSSELIKQVYHGKHDYLINGVKNNQQEQTEEFISLIKSV